MAYMHETPGKYVPAKTNEGWGVAGLVGLLTALCIAGAWYAYAKTYHHPTDVRMQAAGTHAPAGPAAH